MKHIGVNFTITKYAISLYFSICRLNFSYVAIDSSCLNSEILNFSAFNFSNRNYFFYLRISTTFSQQSINLNSFFILKIIFEKHIANIIAEQFTKMISVYSLKFSISRNMNTLLTTMPEPKTIEATKVRLLNEF